MALAATLFFERANSQGQFSSSQLPAEIHFAAALIAGFGLLSAISGGFVLAASLAIQDLTPANGMEGSFGGGGVKWLFPGLVMGEIGLAIAGLALLILAPALRRVGGIPNVFVVGETVLGIAIVLRIPLYLFSFLIFTDYLLLITRVGFLFWLVVVGLWLAAPRLRAIDTP